MQRSLCDRFGPVHGTVEGDRDQNPQRYSALLCKWHANFGFKCKYCKEGFPLSYTYNTDVQLSGIFTQKNIKRILEKDVYISCSNSKRNCIMKRFYHTSNDITSYTWSKYSNILRTDIQYEISNKAKFEHWFPPKRTKMTIARTNTHTTVAKNKNTSSQDDTFDSRDKRLDVCIQRSSGPRVPRSLRLKHRQLGTGPSEGWFIWSSRLLKSLRNIFIWRQIPKPGARGFCATVVYFVCVCVFPFCELQPLCRYYYCMENSSGVPYYAEGRLPHLRIISPLLMHPIKYIYTCLCVCLRCLELKITIKNAKKYRECIFRSVPILKRNSLIRKR